MIYVVQNNSASSHKVIYAGSSAHDALMAAANQGYVIISAFKNGKKFVVSEAKPQERGE